MPAVNNEILIWARNEAKLSEGEAAKKLDIKKTKELSSVERLRKYEDGSESPSRSLLIRMSEVYKRSLLAFYLLKKPRKGNRGEDYRTSSEIELVKNDSKVDVLVREIWVRQSILKSVMEDDEYNPLDFVKSILLNQDKYKVVSQIFEILKFDLNKFYKSSKPEKAFSYLRGLCEDVGVFVVLMGNLGSHHTKIDSKVFRGFALSDNICPFVVINDNDHKAAYSFTLLHEFVHILLGRTGISGKSVDKDVEKYCNSIAGQVLLPDEVLSQLLINKNDSVDRIAEDVGNFAGDHNLSASMVAYRLYLNRRIDRFLWSKLSNVYYQGWLEGKIRKSQEKNKKIPYYNVKRNKLGSSLINVVQGMMQSGALTRMKASKVLNVNANNIQKLFNG